jgi:DNA-binding response OmpR family regulator
LNILAVEDDSAVAQFLALVLGGENCKVATACSGKKALAKIGATARPFDVVITDHRMPRMSGLELVRQLRARNFGGKVVVLSAYLTESNSKAYEELGVDVMISKPFDVDELRRTIDVLGVGAQPRGENGQVALSGNCNASGAAWQSKGEGWPLRGTLDSRFLGERSPNVQHPMPKREGCSSVAPRRRQGRHKENQLPG